MKQRIISAIIFGSIVLLMVFANEYSFHVLLLIICFYSHIEYSKIADPEGNKGIFYALGATLITLLLLLFLNYCTELRTLSKQIIVILNAINLAIIMYAILRLSGIISKSTQGTLGLIRGLFYLIPPLILFATLGRYLGEYSALVVLLIFLLVWINDSAAYFIGSKFGKHKMAPIISPKKTWEGFVGGLILTSLTSSFIISYLTPLELVDGLWLGILTSIFGPLGDLFESQLKRSVGLKDSGDLIPGHGGILDRFDALFFVIPVCAIYLTYLK